ncbi:aldose 1-epimerase [Variovorax saccharolyticus]|uniref:aldose 1-epimerase n=1 Tax=Variovorax saccharolyticus TaxID=3053516 RepID=UPI002577A33F|nr:aldose 1-epimerase [Variovorax sp. J31P216]MDM0026919.1 aldose 1-epimerase [Variovorax sp. J31P216]
MNHDETDAAGSGGLVELAAGRLRLLLAPQVGGAIAALHEQRGGERLDWLRPASAQDVARGDPFAMGSFPLLPWCNRIRDSRARFAGRDIAIAATHPARPSGKHALHGLGWLRPWQVAEAGPAHARLTLAFEADDQWPWAFEASQRFELDPAGLRCTLALTNRDTAPMPAGIGHHPYFAHRPGTRLRSATAAMWRSDAEVMPVALEPTAEVARLREGVLLSELDLDNNFAGWQREARIEWPDVARTLVLAAEAPLDFFVLYCPRGGGHFCAEPVSQCTDAINLAGRHGPEEIGGAVLAPGETLAGSWTLRSA